MSKKERKVGIPSFHKIEVVHREPIEYYIINVVCSVKKVGKHCSTILFNIPHLL